MTAGIVLLLSGLTGTPDARAQDGIDGMRLLGRNEDEFAHMMDFHIVGDYAYASVGLGQGLQTYDISDPTNPVRTSAGGFPGWRAWAQGDTLFNFCHENGVQLFDISGGAAVLLDTYNPSDPLIYYEGGVRVGNFLFVAAHQEGIQILNVGPGGPSLISSISLADNACWNVTVSGGYLYVANGRFGLSVVDLSGPSEIATLQLPGLANDIELSGQTAFLSLAAEGVASVDISDPSNPIFLDRVETFGNAFSMGRVGDILAVGSYPYVERFDVSDPHSLTRAGWDATKVYAMGADAGALSSGDTVIVVADWRGMGVYGPEPDPNGDIEVYPLRLDFGEVTAVASRDTTVRVRNNGAGTLQVASIVTPSGISVNPTAFTVDPGGFQLVTVTASGLIPLRDEIRYVSNDPDESAFVQYVYKNNASFPQAGSLAPDFTLLGTDGNWHTLSDYRGRVIYLEFGATW
jgi:hypothetical protein